jgi:putative ABC transport system permease protein
MIRNYLKIAWRNLSKHKGDAAINLVGLCVAFTAALLLFLSVFFEFSYDNFHKNKSSIYHVYTKVYGANGIYNSTAVPIPMMPSLKEEYADVQYYSRYISSSGNIRYKDKQLTQNLRFTDPDFFRMFSFPFVDGDAQTALADLNSVVLTQKAAERIFGSEQAVGKTFQLQMGGEWKPFTVSAVAADFPDNSSISFDMITRFENTEIYNDSKTIWDNWNHSAYIQLKDGVNPEQFSKKVNSFYAAHFAQDIAAAKRDGAKPAADGAYMQLGLIPLADLHTQTEMPVEGSSIGKNYLYLLLAIGLLILLIACINFVNLSIGRSFTRSHEIGLRKTLGAMRWQVVGQLWVEALLICFFALAVSAVLTYFLLPSYKLLFGLHVQRQLLLSPATWLLVCAAFLFVSLIAGGYPAWLISKVNVVSILKGKFSIRRSQAIRNSLIVVQFAIAVLLMICTFITWRQVNFLRNQPLGYNRNQVISVPIEGDQDPNLVLERLRQSLDGYPNVQSVSGIYNNLGRGLDGSTRNSTVGFDYKERNIRTGWMGVSYDFAKTLDLQLVAGRDFSRTFPTDSNALVINEAMAKQLGEKEVIGLQLPVHDSASYMTVIGVVKDFNYESLHKKIEPVSFTIERPFGVHYALIKVAPANLPSSMALIKNVWKKILPNAEFKGSFLDENIDRQYRKEEKLGQIFISGAILAIVLSCMGLLAMVLLIVTQRVKEIGIRKVLGASVPNIVLLISKDFLWLVLIAFIIAAPLGWWSMQKWLEQFAYRINVEWWMFGIAAVLAFTIAFVTISIQSIRAALSNPVDNLRTE